MHQQYTLQRLCFLRDWFRIHVHMHLQLPLQWDVVRNMSRRLHQLPLPQFWGHVRVHLHSYLLGRRLLELRHWVLLPTRSEHSKMISLLCEKEKWEVAARFLGEALMAMGVGSGSVERYTMHLYCTSNWVAALQFFGQSGFPVISHTSRAASALTLLRRGYDKVVISHLRSEGVPVLVTVARDLQCDHLCHSLHTTLSDDGTHPKLAEVLMLSLVRHGHWEFALYGFSVRREMSGNVMGAVIDQLMENGSWAQALHTYQVYEQTCYTPEDSRPAVVSVVKGLVRLGHTPLRGVVVSHLLQTMAKIPQERAMYEAFDCMVRKP